MTKKNNKIQKQGKKDSLEARLAKEEAVEVDHGIEEIRLSEEAEGENAAEIILAKVYPSTEPEEPDEETVEEDKGPILELADSNLAQETLEEMEEIEPLDLGDSFYVAPQVAEEAHKFLNRYGIKTEGLTDKEVMEKIEKIQAAKEEAAQVLSRGRALDGIERLLDFVPEGYVGGFFRFFPVAVNLER